MATSQGANIAISNAVTASTNLPAALATGDLGFAAVGYSPSLGALTVTPVNQGWTLIEDVTFGASFHLLIYKKNLTAADSSTAITVTGPTQKFAIGYDVIRGGTAMEQALGAEFVGSVVQNTQALATFANTTRNVQVAFWCERESTPSTTVSVPAGFTRVAQAYQLSSGATSMVIGVNLTEKPAPGPIGGGVFTSDVPNDAVITYVIGITVPNPYTPTPYDGLGVTYHMNRLAGTLSALGAPTLRAVAAANVYAGTTGLTLTGALNAKAGTTGLTTVGALNALAGTTGLDTNAAAASIG